MKIIKLTLMILLVISNLMFAQTVSDYFLQPHVGDYWIYHSNTLMGQANTPWTIHIYQFSLHHSSDYVSLHVEDYAPVPSSEGPHPAVKG